MQNYVFHLRCLAESAETFSTGKRHRSAAGKNLRRVIKKDLVHYAGGKRSPVYQRAAFNQQAGDFQFAQASDYPGEIRASVTGAERDLLYTNTMFFELAAFF